MFLKNRKLANMPVIKHNKGKYLEKRINNVTYMYKMSLLYNLKMYSTYT